MFKLRKTLIILLTIISYGARINPTEVKAKTESAKLGNLASTVNMSGVLAKVTPFPAGVADLTVDYLSTWEQVKKTDI